MSSFCTAKASHIFFSKKFQHICISLVVNFNESLTNDIVSFEQLGHGFLLHNIQVPQPSVGVYRINLKTLTLIGGEKYVMEKFT